MQGLTKGLPDGPGPVSKMRGTVDRIVKDQIGRCCVVMLHSATCIFATLYYLECFYLFNFLLTVYLSLIMFELSVG